jgi:hypothetical protein
MQNVRFAGQFLCSYSTLPVYALVTQVTHFSDGNFSSEMLEMHQYIQEGLVMHVAK